MKELSFFRLPLLWLFLGPPAFRNAGTRGAAASMEGDNDIWNYIRLVWWLFWGAVALYDLIRSRHLFSEFFGRLGTLPAWTVLFLVSIFASCVVSPAPMYSVVMSFMMLILVVAALDFSLKLYLGAVSLATVYRIIMILTVGLLLLVFVIYKTNPLSNVAMEAFFGYRVRGGTVAYTPLLSLIAIFLGAYYVMSSREVLPRVLAVAAILFAFHMLSLGQTRSSYLGFFLGAFCFVSFRWKVWRNVVFLFISGALLVTFVALLLFSYDVSHSARWRLDQYYKRYVLRDRYAVQDAEFAKENIGSLNGRGEVFVLLAEQAFWKPLGLGFIAGPRDYLSHAIKGLPSAHNGYTEVWAGSGLFGFLGFVGTVLIVFFRGRHLRARDALPVRVLLPVIMLEGMFESDIVFAFVQSSVFLWILAALVTGMFAREERLRASTRPALNRRRQPLSASSVF